ncbi:hypothetical protein EDB85DRAFT_1888740 [Lactarius pseudohatsudake]|nr:hypothetical protein EDB85DRAFT_1888740 [Lactarius pseudohatsudake]
MTLESTFAESDGGGRIHLPCRVIPNKKTDVPEHLQANVVFLEAGQSGVPWTGYFAIWRGVKQALCMYQGVWFEIRYDKEVNGWKQPLAMPRCLQRPDSPPPPRLPLIANLRPNLDRRAAEATQSPG